MGDYLYFVMNIEDRIESLRLLAKAEAEGDRSVHHALLRGIRELQQAVETPIETTSRLNFQVCRGRITFGTYWTTLTMQGSPKHLPSHRGGERPLASNRLSQR